MMNTTLAAPVQANAAADAIADMLKVVADPAASGARLAELQAAYRAATAAQAAAETAKREAAAALQLLDQREIEIAGRENGVASKEAKFAQVKAEIEAIAPLFEASAWA